MHKHRLILSSLMIERSMKEKLTKTYDFCKKIITTAGLSGG